MDQSGDLCDGYSSQWILMQVTDLNASDLEISAIHCTMIINDQRILPVRSSDGLSFPLDNNWIAVDPDAGDSLNFSLYDDNQSTDNQFFSLVHSLI